MDHVCWVSITVLSPAAWMAQPPSTFSNEHLATFPPVTCRSPPNLIFTTPMLTKKTMNNTLAAQHFPTLHPKLLNILPITLTLREQNSKETFKKNLKTYLFPET